MFSPSQRIWGYETPDGSFAQFARVQDRQLMLDLEDHALRASQGGFDAIFLPDHHFNGYMPLASDSFIYAAYLSAKMPHMHFGFSVVSVPLHHPVRFAERVNLLDQITGGKLLVGVGSGTTPEEMIGFAVNYKDASALAEKNLAIAEELWAKRMDDMAEAAAEAAFLATEGTGGENIPAHIRRTNTDGRNLHLFFLFAFSYKYCIIIFKTE